MRCPRLWMKSNSIFMAHTLSGQPQQQDRWKRCVQATDGALGEALGEVYVKTYFPAENKQKTVQMVHDIEDAMDRNIGTLTWMSEETKAKAREKLHMVADKIAYPDHWRDYSTLTVVRGDALGNAMRAREFENRRQLAKIGKPVDRGEWQMSPPTINAYYDPSMNDINFPAGILQPPFFDPNATDAENYGHIGAIEGHELTHGFDDQGRQFDGNGNLRRLVDGGGRQEVRRHDGLRSEGIRRLYGDRRCEAERQADAGREHGGQRRIAPCVYGHAGGCKAQRHRPERKGCERIYGNAAVLHSVRTELVWRHAARNGTDCRCRPIRTRRRSFASRAWCRICRSLARHSDARPGSR